MHTTVHLAGGGKISLPCGLDETAKLLAPTARNSSGMCAVSDTRDRRMLINPERILYLEEFDPELQTPFVIS
jgi:hypothetical protein